MYMNTRGTSENFNMIFNPPFHFFHLNFKHAKSRQRYKIKILDPNKLSSVIFADDFQTAFVHKIIKAKRSKIYIRFHTSHVLMILNNSKYPRHTSIYKRRKRNWSRQLYFLSIFVMFQITIMLWRRHWQIKILKVF